MLQLFQNYFFFLDYFMNSHLKGKIIPGIKIVSIDLVIHQNDYLNRNKNSTLSLSAKVAVKQKLDLRGIIDKTYKFVSSFFLHSKSNRKV